MKVKNVVNEVFFARMRDFANVASEFAGLFDLLVLQMSFSLYVTWIVFWFFLTVISYIV